MDPVWGDCLRQFTLTTSEGIEKTYDVVTIACIPHLAQNLVSAAVLFGGLVALFFIIWGGFKLARSGGDPKQLEGARNTIVYAIIGLVLVFFSFFIINLVATVTGVQCITYFGLQSCAPSETAWGCFYNTDPNAGRVTNGAECWQNDPAGNDPRIPLSWYETEDLCQDHCVPPGQPLPSPSQ